MMTYTIKLFEEIGILFRSLFISVLTVYLFSMAGFSYAGNISHRSFDSGTLARGYSYNVYLPEGYDSGTAVYPVLYLLHGSFGSEKDWPIQGNVKVTADRLIDEGAIPPTIIVMPGSNSWWVDGHNEDAETAFFADLIPHVEASYRARKDRGGRFVAGLSAGGYGTINFVLEHPDMFAAGAALSPASYYPYPPLTSSAYKHPAFLGSNGEFDKALWDSLNYTHYIASYKTRGLVVPLYISTGDHDVYDIAYHSAMLYQSLREHQPDLVEFRVVDGDHDWTVWAGQLPEALTYILGFVGPIK